MFLCFYKIKKKTLPLKDMRTAVVILNWNTKEYLRAFLPALLHSCGSGAEVVVADSASADGSMEMMAAEFPGVKTIPLDANYGFTGGYNRALAQLDAEFFVLINSDILVEDAWLEPLVAWMDAHPECGICGPKLHGLVNESGEYRKTSMFEYAGAAGGYLDRFGFPFCRGRVLSKVCEDQGQYDNPADVLWVTGACLMIRSSLWKPSWPPTRRPTSFRSAMRYRTVCFGAPRSTARIAPIAASATRPRNTGTVSAPY